MRLRAARSQARWREVPNPLNIVASAWVKWSIPANAFLMVDPEGFSSITTDNAPATPIATLGLTTPMSALDGMPMVTPTALGSDASLIVVSAVVAWDGTKVGVWAKETTSPKPPRDFFIFIVRK